MRMDHWLSLQFFAGEGAAPGGDAGGAEAGVNAANPGQEDELEELKFPKEAAERFRKTREKRNGTERQSEPAKVPEKTQSSAAAEAPAAKKDEEEPAKGRMSIAEVFADPEYNKAIQETVSRRLKEYAASEGKAKATLNTLAPALQTLARKYDMAAGDIGQIDAAALAKAINEDDSFYEDVAAEYGVSNETARKIAGYEALTREKQKAEKDALERQRVREHYEKLSTQAEEMKALYPGFDLDKELENPVFLRWTSPQYGMSVKDAYYALHREEVQTAEAAALAQKMQEAMANKVMAGQARPTERAGGQGASISQMPPAKKTAAERAALKQKILEAAARGEKIYPR